VGGVFVPVHAGLDRGSCPAHAGIVGKTLEDAFQPSA
jgi:hypothetical protein